MVSTICDPEEVESIYLAPMKNLQGKNVSSESVLSMYYFIIFALFDFLHTCCPSRSIFCGPCFVGMFCNLGSKIIAIKIILKFNLITALKFNMLNSDLLKFTRKKNHLRYAKLIGVIAIASLNSQKHVDAAVGTLKSNLSKSELMDIEEYNEGVLAKKYMLCFLMKKLI